jgi:mannose-6-phosphate isomerase-like protein (cupin superfamily)
MNCPLRRFVFLSLSALFLISHALLAEDVSAPKPIEVVNIEKQPWATADDHAVARQIVSPSNSRAQTMSIADIIVPPGVEIRRHHHKVIEEVYYITAGEGIMYLNGATKHVGVGDAIVIRPGDIHSIRNPTKSDLRMIVTCVPPWTPDCLIFNP